jgi:hypothetical protein
MVIGTFIECASKLTPVPGGCHPNRLAKCRPEIALVAKSDLPAQIRKWNIRRRQKPLGLGHAQIFEIGDKRLTGHALEKVYKARLAHINHRSRIADRNPFRNLLVNKIQDRAQTLDVPHLVMEQPELSTVVGVMVPKKH